MLVVDIGYNATVKLDFVVVCFDVDSFTDYGNLSKSSIDRKQVEPARRAIPIVAIR